MNKSGLVFFVALAALAFSACRLFQDQSAQDVEAKAQEMDQRAKESQTLTSRAKIEEALGAYVKEQGKIPASLKDLVPKYLAVIPAVELGLSAHRDTARVTIYQSSILRDGQIDGSKIDDRGGWGYVFNDRQVVVFVDCTHQSSRGRGWYLERDVY